MEYSQEEREVSVSVIGFVWEFEHSVPISILSSVNTLRKHTFGDLTLGDELQRHKFVNCQKIDTQHWIILGTLPPPETFNS